MTETTTTETNESTDQEELKTTNTKTAWIIAATVIVISISLFLIGLRNLGVIIFCTTFILFGFNLKEIKDPDIAFLFRFGKLIGQLRPGIYLGLPLADSIEEISQETQQIIRLKEPMYTKDKTDIAFDIGIYYVLTNLNGAIRTRNIIRDRIKDIVLSKVKGFVGQSTFKGLLETKADLENNIIEAVNKDLSGTDSSRPQKLKDDGYEVIGIEISNIIERVESVAARGEIEAKIDGKRAEAVANPLKDNFPAAIVMIVNAIVSQLGDRLEEMFKREKQTKGTPTTEGSDTT